MQSKAKKILVLFVEPMLYGFDLIREVYEKTAHKYQYVFCDTGLTGKDNLELPKGAIVCSGCTQQRQKQIKSIFDSFSPDFAIINGYVGIEQVAAIKYCQKHGIRYAIESDTPLHVPESKIKALLKKVYLRRLLSNKYCYGFPGGTLQKENLVYYGIKEENCYTMPMSVSSDRLLEVKDSLPIKEDIKEQYGILDKKVFLFVGRLEPVKNATVLINAFNEIKKDEPNISLVILGDGSQKKTLEALVETKSIEDVHFMGYVTFPKIVEFYKMADVFVLPSTHEPWGLVVNEAMIMGLPVIVSSKVGCRKDLILEGENGEVFEDDNQEMLQEKMKDILRKDLDIYSENSIKRIDQWNFEFYLRQFTGAICDE